MRNMVLSKIDLAFKLCGDLLVDVELGGVTAGEFNMGAMVLATTPETPKALKAVFLQETKLKGATAEILLKAAEAGDASIYRTATINGKVWKVVEPIINDSYLIRIGLN